MKILKVLFSRIAIIIYSAIFELFIIFCLYHFFQTQFAWIETILRLFSTIVVIGIINNSKHLSSDIMWILLLMLFPVFAMFAYFLLVSGFLSSSTTKALIQSTEESKKYYVQDPSISKEIEENPQIQGQYHYIWNHAGFPFYHNDKFDYYALGEIGYPIMLEELEKAERFIFLEYFIIEEGKMWDGIHNILKRKAEQGVDVRVMYDDMGSAATLKTSYATQLEKEGIKCVRFNKINPILGIIMNHRDHRKILVIDGKVAFSGGINLADEYINAIEKYGRWKDNCIRIQGEAVYSYTLMFLTHWNALRKTDDDYSLYRISHAEQGNNGYIVPYGDTPLDDEHIGQDIYLNILNSAQKYVYIMTPYLIIDNELKNALILCANRGVDVRIIMPGVPDKKIIWDISRSYYWSLIQSGVKIYEYTPGFVHAKVFVSDDHIAAVGTINLDYRSLYLHFENGTFLYHVKEIEDIKKDFIETNNESHLVETGDLKCGLFKRIIISIVKLFAGEL